MKKLSKIFGRLFALPFIIIGCVLIPFIVCATCLLSPLILAIYWVITGESLDFIELFDFIFETIPDKIHELI